MAETPTKDAPAAKPADQQWAELAASLSVDKAARAASASPAEPKAPAGLARAVVASSLALLLAFIAVMVAGMLWWQYRQFYVSLDETDAAAAVALERVRAEHRSLTDRLEDVDADVDTLRQLHASLGERLDAAAIVKQCDVLFTTSCREGFPNVVLEAMAAGLPVVASDIPVFREYLTDDDAMLVPPGDPDALAHAMARLAEDAELRARLSARGRRLAGRFTWQASARRHAAFYAGLARPEGR